MKFESAILDNLRRMGEIAACAESYTLKIAARSFNSDLAVDRREVDDDRRDDDSSSLHGASGKAICRA